MLCLALGTVAAAAADGPAGSAARPPGGRPAFRPYARPVTTWVPPYAVERSKARLTGEAGVKEALTHLGLQFWVPTGSGGVERVKHREVTDAAVAELRDWGHANGVRVMLCVYNHVGGKWDWSVARAAFADHRAAFVKNLVAAVERVGLDGVDVDLEGAGAFEADKAAFVAFVAELSKELRARGRHLTVDTFAHKWNAPNATWWAELLPLVDALASMGYEEIGSAAPDWRGYAAQIKAAGEHGGKFQIGMLSSKDAWRGNTAAEQVEWVAKDGRAGIAIWDAQLRAAAWREAGVWEKVKAVRDGRE